MIIEGNKVQGIFLYNSDSVNIEFTKDDLVVSGNSIYICNAESVSGIDPSSDTEYEYYRPYPGNKISTASEFFQYVENLKEGSSVGGDKYVSVQAIIGILQGYQFGLDMEGIITDWINKDGDTTLVLSNPTDRPLDNLMLTETLNRGMVKISHELSQIMDGTVDGKPFSTLFGFLTKEGVEYSLILSQYTYKSSDTVWIRIQEMMSPLTGVSVYRYMTWRVNEFPTDGSVISGWRNVFSYSSAIQSKMDALQKYYENISQQRASQIAALSGSFRFREVYAGGTETTGLESGIYTVCLREQQPNGGEYLGSIYKSESVVVKLSSDGREYRVNLNNLNGYLTVTSSSIKSSGPEIISIYRREERL